MSMSHFCRYCRIIHRPVPATSRNESYLINRKNDQIITDLNPSSKSDQDLEPNQSDISKENSSLQLLNDFERLYIDKLISKEIQDLIDKYSSNNNQSLENIGLYDNVTVHKGVEVDVSEIVAQTKCISPKISNLTERVYSDNRDLDLTKLTKRCCDRIGQTIIMEDKNLQKHPHRMDWNEYHRLDIIYEYMNSLETDFPSICTVGAIGNSIEGRQLKILRISNSHANNVSVWMDAGIHAREWIGPAVATFIADHITKNFNTLPSYITNKDWYFLPVMNPDGYEYSHTDERLWRKNRAWHGDSCVGVDLNRNFSVGWGTRGSSNVPSNAFYRGTKAFSEPESTAVKDFILSAGVSFKVYITLHSFGQIIIMPFAYRDQLCPDYIRLLEGASVMSKAIFETSGNIYKVGLSKDLMYRASGTSNDWSYGEAKIPYCYLIELRSKKHQFKLPKEEIEETGNEILNCVKALMEYVDNYNTANIGFAGDSKE